MVRLYNAYLQPTFQYCSDVWHFCSARSREKLEQLNKQVLRIVLNDRTSSYLELLEKLNKKTLEQHRIDSMLTTVFKAIHGTAPAYLIDKLRPRQLAYNLRGHGKLLVPRVKTTKYGLQSFRYKAVWEWNRLSDSVRGAETLAAFRRGVQQHVSL